MKKLLSALLITFGASLSAQIYTQTAQYTWMSGPNTLNAASGFGTKGVPSTTNTPASIYEATSWGDNSGNLWVFGGNASSANRFNALFRYNTATNEWTWISGSNSYNAIGVYGTKGVASASNTPGARNSAFKWKDLNGNLWLFGGYGYGTTATIGDLNDLWKFDVTTNQWTWVSGSNTINPAMVYGTMGVTTTSNVPNGRMGGTTWTDNAGNLWLYGGYNAAGNRYQADLWKYDIAIDQWTWISGSSSFNIAGVYGTKGTPSSTNFPGSRVSAVSMIDANNNFWFFGGSGTTGELNDLWKYNPTTNEWTWTSGLNTINGQGLYGVKGVPSTTNTPGCRRSAISWSDNNDLYIHGGWGMNSTSLTGHMNDLWKYNTLTNEWTWLSGIDGRNSASVYGTKGIKAISNLIGGRSQACSFKDNNGYFWIFSGRDFTTGVMANTNDLWKLEFCNAPTAVNSTVASNTVICAGKTTTLSATGVGTLGWYSAAIGGTYLGAGANFATPVLSSTSTYYIQDSTCGPGNRTAVTVSVMAIPNLAISNLSVCANGSVNLIASGANTYTWSTGSNSQTLTTYPSADETYTLSGTNTSNGCSNSIVRTLTVVPLPTLTVTPNYTICSGQTASLGASGAIFYQWNTGPTTASITVSPGTTTNYTVTGFGIGNCTSKESILVTVKVSPSLTLTPTTTTMCAGALMTLTVAGAPSYTWNGGANTNTLQISPTSNTSYTVIGEAANGCTSAVVRNIATLASPTVSISGSTVTCAGNAVPLIGSGATTYTWSTGAFTSSITISPTITTTYSVTGKNVNVCTKTATVLIMVNPLPILNVSTTNTLLCTGQTSTLSVLGATSYTWSDNTNGTEIAITPSTTSNYTVSGTDAIGCQNSSIFTQSVTICTDIVATHVLNNSVIVFPNPNNGEFTIQSQIADVITITNELGQTIETIQLNNQNNYSSKINNLSSGVYFLIGTTTKQKVVVTN